MKKASQSEATTFNTLRSYAKHRILNDMIDKARRHSHSKDYMIMVLDAAALRVFSSCCKFFDVYKANMYHIERLEVKRKKFQHTDALYFISPTQASVNHLLQDFSDEKKQTYGGVHLCFTSKLSDELFKQIAGKKSLAPRVLSFNEINLDFFLFNDNVYHLSRKNVLPMFKLSEEKRGIDTPVIQKALDEMCHRLFTVCSVFMENPYVQYQGNSPLCKTLAVKLNKALTDFYSVSHKDIKVREPRGTFLLLDRTFDLISPVLHDYYYQSLVYDLRDVGDEGELMLTDQKMVFLNDQDDLWVRLRNKHIAEVHATLNTEVSAVAAESKKKVGSKGTDEMSLQDMAEVIRSMPKYEEMMKKYQVHMDLINKGITEFTTSNLRKLIALEQDIITGLDSKGQKVNNTNLVKEISQINKQLKEEDYVRLLIIYFVCYELNKKDKDTLMKSVENDSYRHVLANLEYLDSALLNASKFRRRHTEMTTDQYNDFTRRFAASDYEILRTEPMVCQLIKGIHEETIDAKKYPMVVEKAAKIVQGKKDQRQRGATIAVNEFERQDALENPRIFVYVIGGLSQHEIVSIANMQENINAQLIPGANEILKNAKEFMGQIEKLHKKESDQAFARQIMENTEGNTSKKRQGAGDEDDDGQDYLDTEGDGKGSYAINM